LKWRYGEVAVHRLAPSSASPQKKIKWSEEILRERPIIQGKFALDGVLLSRSISSMPSGRSSDS
jgi:hypothetical protein